jgi:two-component system CheB/CheR fusion protein
MPTRSDPQEATMSRELDGEPGHLVVVGSSAGGIEALGVLVSGLSERFPAPVVLAQHLDPTRPSQLSGILERRSILPVATVTDDTKLQPGRIYVVPSNRHVMIQDSRVRLEADHGDRPRPSIDLLLSSAARSYGDKLIAVILTGSGSDGAEGAVAVKEAGGCVVIQNPRTAAHPSMPSALPPTAVDHVANLDQIAPLLGDILRGTVIAKRIESVDPDALSEVLDLVTRQGSIDFRQYKSTTILRRISRRMAMSHTHTLAEYRDYLNDNPQEVGLLTKSLLIKVTEFFRDPEAFAFLESEVMPKLIQAGRERGRVLRFWSAGCATGEESYSLVLLLAHMLGKEFAEWSIKIFATDVDEDSIAYARRGFYPPNILQNLPEEYRSQYFEGADQGFRVGKMLRQRIVFGTQDLSRGIPFPRIDLVVCRNLLIYFNPELQQAVLDLFAYSLHATQGYLFLGKAETARPSKSTYELVNKKWKIYRCVSGPLPVPARSSPDTLQAPDTARIGPAQDAPTRPVDMRVGEADLRKTGEVILRNLPVGVCLIDRSYRILNMNPTARRLLGVHDAATDQDFLHTVRGLPYVEVRASIDRAFREKAAVVLPHIEMGVGSGERRFLNLQVVPLEGTSWGAALLCLENATEMVQTQRRLEAVQAEQDQLAHEVGSANQRLTEMNKELQDANEELQAANEEMMLAQEELQATNEEFEATNEELQATNEELETNNEEFQATNEELETTNEELQARTSELQELMRVVNAERGRLSEIVEQAPFQIVVLRHSTLTIESMNPRLAGLFRESAFRNRPFEEICIPALESVRVGVRRTFVEDRPWHSERLRTETPEGERFHEFSAMPTHGTEGQVDGVVLYAEDVTDRWKREQEDRLRKLTLMIEHANQLAMALFDARSRQLLHATQQYLEILKRLRKIEPAGAYEGTWDSLWFGGRDSLDRFERVVREGHPERLNEVHVPVPAGGAEKSVWDCTLIPIPTEDGGDGVEYVVLTAVEVTRPVLAREALEQVDRLKDDFLSLASHELRTPLTPLAAYVELLAHLVSENRRDPEWGQRVNDVTTKLRRQIGYMSRLTEDLVDISRIRSGKLTLDLKSTDLRRIVEQGRDQALALVRNGSIQLQVVEGEEPIIAEADEMRLVQVVFNFLSNALKHAAGSDRVQVSVRTRGENGQMWGRVEVRDFGDGIPAPLRQDLFHRFMTVTSNEGRTARAGLGLGLYISARIVEQHGGRIGVEHHDPGTTAWFEIPLLR